MELVIVRRTPGITWSMDVYADNLVAHLRQIRPLWKITEIAPALSGSWRSGTGLSKYYKRYWHHPKAMSRRSGDLFHVIDHTDGHIVRWLQQSGRSVIATCHDLVPLTCPENLRSESRLPAISSRTWRYSAAGLKAADRVLCVSANTAADVAQFLQIKHRQLAVVHSAADKAFVPLKPDVIQDFRQQQGRTPEDWVLLHVGSNQLRKNVSNILKALKIAVDRGVPAHLWRVGDGFNPEQRSFIARSGLAAHITTFDLVDQSTLVQLYNAADVTLFPSLYEGFGFPILESMACGTAVITSNTSSLPEVAGESAILVDPTQPQAMAEAIVRLYVDRGYGHRLVQSGLHWGKQFSWRITAEKTAQIYEQVLESKSWFANASGFDARHLADDPEALGRFISF
jgi:glycosyltransferase involved in cell wall biosynthesis